MCNASSLAGAVAFGGSLVALVGLLVFFLPVRDVESNDVSYFGRVAIFLSFLQVLSNLGHTNVAWPESSQTVFGVLSFAQLNVELFSAECTSHDCDYRCKTLLFLGTPPVLVAVIWLVFAIVKVAHRCGSERMLDIRLRCQRASALVLLASFLVISQRLFDGLNCQPVDIAGEVQYRLAVDNAVVCYSPAHGLPGIVVGLLVYPVGLMVALVCMLGIYARPLKGESSGQWWAIFTNQYTQQYYWFELVNMGFRLLVAAAVTMSASSSFSSLNMLLFSEVGPLCYLTFWACIIFRGSMAMCSIVMCETVVSSFCCSQCSQL
jgi:hypothetical protein